MNKVRAAIGRFPYPHATRSEIAYPRLYMTWPMYKRQQCYYNGLLKHIPVKEIEILLCLLLRRGALVKTNDLIEFVYPNPDLEPNWAENCIAARLKLLRKRIPGMIFTEGHRGYYIEKEKTNVSS